MADTPDLMLQNGDCVLLIHHYLLIHAEYCSKLRIDYFVVASCLDMGR